jgi:hypothetical protein
MHHMWRWWPWLVKSATCWQQGKMSPIFALTGQFWPQNFCVPAHLFVSIFLHRLTTSRQYLYVGKYVDMSLLLIPTSNRNLHKYQPPGCIMSNNTIHTKNIIRRLPSHCIFASCCVVVSHCARFVCCLFGWLLRRLFVSRRPVPLVSHEQAFTCASEEFHTLRMEFHRDARDIPPALHQLVSHEQEFFSQHSHILPNSSTPSGRSSWVMQETSPPTCVRNNRPVRLERKDKRRSW